MERSYSVYFLRDPRTGEVGYVGLSHQPKKRFLQHWGDAYPTKVKSAWFSQLKRSELKPELQIVFTGLTRDQAVRVENAIVQSWAARGVGNMLHQSTKQKVFFTKASDVLPFLEKRFLQCSLSCKREVISHLQTLAKKHHGVSGVSTKNPTKDAI